MAIQYKQKTIEDFKKTAKSLLEIGSSDLSDLRPRYEYIDRYVARESDRSAETLEAKRRCMAGDKTVLRNFEPPVMIGQLDSAHAYFTEVFLSGYPIFGVVANKMNEDQAMQMHALMGRDSVRFSWARELMLCFNDTLRYNVGAAETEWVVKAANKLDTGAEGTKVVSKQTRVEYAGNCIKRINPYNVFWDQSVDPAYIPEDGLFAGYTEIYNYIKVRRLLQQLSLEFKILPAISEALKSSTSVDPMHFIPEIRSDSSTTKTGTTDWNSFFGLGNDKYKGNTSGMYEVTKLYVRLIPKEYNVVIPQAGTPRVFKMILLNGHLIYAEPLQYAHELIPISFMQAYDDGQGMETKSFCENLMDIQDIATSLQNGRLKSLRRAVSDRGLYDSTRIRKADIDRAQPDAKIAVKMNQYHKDLQSAYHAIPYRDDAGATINQEYSMVMGMSSAATGLNQAMQGNFVKGNRTLSEYDDITGNAQARLRKMSVLWEGQFFMPVKHMLRSNYLQFAINEEIVDTNSGKQVTVDPVKLREVEMNFKVSDGVLPSEKLINSQAMQYALSAFSSLPELAREFKIAEMAVSIVKSAGLPDLNEYKRTKEEVADYDARQQAQLAAAQGQPAATAG